MAKNTDGITRGMRSCLSSFVHRFVHMLADHFPPPGQLPLIIYGDGLQCAESTVGCLFDVTRPFLIFYLAICLAYILKLYRTYVATFDLAFFLALYLPHTRTFYLAFCLRYISAFFPAFSLTCVFIFYMFFFDIPFGVFYLNVFWLFILAFYLAFSLAVCLAFHLVIWTSGSAVPHSMCSWRCGVRFQCCVPFLPTTVWQTCTQVQKATSYRLGRMPEWYLLGVYARIQCFFFKN
jgi:hypothetical protein